MVRDRPGLPVLLASLAPETRRVSVIGLADGSARIRTLDEARFTLAIDDPESFRAGGEQQEACDGRRELEPPPYAVVRVDL